MSLVIAQSGLEGIDDSTLFTDNYQVFHVNNGVKEQWIGFNTGNKMRLRIYLRFRCHFMGKVQRMIQKMVSSVKS